MTTEQGSWLSCGRAGEAEQEDCRSAKRCQKERSLAWPHERESRANADSSAEQAPSKTNRGVVKHEVDCYA